MQDVATATFVGRKAELSSIARFLERVPGGPYALVIEGEAGIGKTTVWVEAARVAEDSGLRMLKARPAESEANLSYAALSDLVGIAFDEVRGVLPAVQERALASVLLRRQLGLLEGRRIAVSLGRDLAAVILPVIAGVAILVALGGTTDGGFAISDRVGAIVSMAVIGDGCHGPAPRHPEPRLAATHPSHTVPARGAGIADA